jgi:hypothetical protein
MTRECVRRAGAPLPSPTPTIEASRSPARRAPASSLYKLRERFDSTRFKNYRIRSLTYVKENYLVNGDILEVQYMDDDTMRIFEFFDDLVHMQAG